MTLFIFIFMIIILVIGFKSIKVVRESEAYIISRLGRFYKVANAGLLILIPFIEKVEGVVSLRHHNAEASNIVITADNVTVKIDYCVFFKIVNPAKVFYEYKNINDEIKSITINIIRKISGNMKYDELIENKDTILYKTKERLKEQSDSFGCQIDRIEFNNIQKEDNKQF